MPANLLLAGEYFVTEEGGLGLALAAAPRLRVGARKRRGGGLVLEGRMGPGSFAWRPGEPAPALVAAVFAELDTWLGPRGLGAGPGAAAALCGDALVEIDSSPFFAADGSKRGLGSSAAVALGLVAALLRLAGIEGVELEEAVLPLALSAHRRAQGGRGSGYDLYASRHGGLGIFVGGALPRWIPASPELGELLRGLDLTIHRGPAPVSSPQALLRYGAWKAAEPAAWEAAFKRSETLVRRLSEARDKAGFLEVLGLAAEAGAALGEAIAVPARAPGLAGGVAKCLGAGDELVLAVRGARETVTAGPETVTAGPGTVTAGPGTVTAGPGTVTAVPGTVTAGPGTVTAGPAEILVPESEGLRWE